MRAHFVTLGVLLTVAASSGCSSNASAPSDASTDAGAAADASPPRDGAIELAVAADCNPLASSAECLFPWPSRFFQSADPTTPTGVRSALRNDAVTLPPTAATLDLTVFNRADGHSPTAPILVHFGLDVDATQLFGQRQPEHWAADGEPIAVFDMGTGERIPVMTEMDQTQRARRFDGRHALIVRPMIAMPLGAHVVVVLTRALRDTTGAPLPTPPGFAALRDRQTTTHPALEAARPAYEELFTFLATHGYPRSEQLLSFDFRVASERHVLGGIRSMRDQALAVAATPGALHATVDAVMEAPNPNVLRIVEGTFEVPTFLDGMNLIHRDAADGAVLQPTPLSFPYTLIVPACAATSGPIPLVLFGHGVFGNGRDYLEGSIGQTLIQPLAQEGCMAVVATDFIGLSSSDRDLLVGELLMDLNRVVIVMDRLQQAIIDNLVLVEVTRDVLQHDPMVRVSATEPLLSDEVYYYGVSLGGIEGSSIVSLSRRISRAVLAVPGGAWATLLTRSSVFAPIKSLVDLQYPDPLLQQTFIALLQERFDGGDGANVAALAFRRPLADAPPSRRFVLFEAIGDCQVPNVATAILARSFGVEQVTPFSEAIPLLTAVASPTTRPALVQMLMPGPLTTYTPPDANLVPSMDNGVHSDSLSQPAALDLVRAVLLDDVVRQTCTGPCDPG